MSGVEDRGAGPSRQHPMRCERAGCVLRACGHSLILLVVLAVVSTARVDAGDTVFEDFETPFGERWEVTGDAFSSGPVAGTCDGQNLVLGYEGSRLVNTYVKRDLSRGELLSAPFTIEHSYIRVLVGGGASALCAVQLLVDGRVERQASGLDSEELRPVWWDVTKWQGREAKLRIVDASSEPWGHILVDQIVFSDEPRVEAGGVRAFGADAVDEVACRVASEYRRLGAILAPKGGHDPCPVDVFVYPTFCRAVGSAGTLVLDVGGNTSFVAPPGTWAADSLTGAYASSDEPAAQEARAAHGINMARDILLALTGGLPWGCGITLVKGERLLAGRVGTVEVTDVPGRLLIRVRGDSGPEYLQLLLDPVGRFCQLSMKLPTEIATWFERHRGHALGREPYLVPYPDEPPLTLGCFYDPGEYRFEVNAHSMGGEAFLDRGLRDCPFAPDGFSVSRPNEVVTQVYRASSEYRRWCWGWWDLYGRVGSWRGNHLASEARAEWEYPRRQLAPARCFADYGLTDPAGVEPKEHVVDGRTLTVPFAVDEQLEPAFYEDLESCNVAALFTHMGTINGVYQFRQQLDVWLRFDPPPWPLGSGSLRHLLLHGCSGIGHYRVGPQDEILTQYWLARPPVRGVRTVCGHDGEAVGLDREGWRFFGHYNRGESICDSWALSQIDECLGNCPVTLAYGATPAEALDTLLNGRFIDQPAEAVWMVGSIWREGLELPYGAP